MNTEVTNTIIYTPMTITRFMHTPALVIISILVLVCTLLLIEAICMCSSAAAAEKHWKQLGTEWSEYRPSHLGGK